MSAWSPFLLAMSLQALDCRFDCELSRPCTVGVKLCYQIENRLLAYTKSMSLQGLTCPLCRHV